jgi:hypothetical protein
MTAVRARQDRGPAVQNLQFRSPTVVGQRVTAAIGWVARSAYLCRVATRLITRAAASPAITTITPAIVSGNVKELQGAAGFTVPPRPTPPVPHSWPPLFAAATAIRPKPTTNAKIPITTDARRMA